VRWQGSHTYTSSLDICNNTHRCIQHLHRNRKTITYQYGATSPQSSLLTRFQASQPKHQAPTKSNAKVKAKTSIFTLSHRTFDAIDHRYLAEKA
jgi:hypothetical protein